MGIAGAQSRVEIRVTPSVSFSITARGRAFCPDGDASGHRNSHCVPTGDLMKKVELGLVHYAHFRPHQALGGRGVKNWAPPRSLSE
jgi:hypothetical protein